VPSSSSSLPIRSSGTSSPSISLPSSRYPVPGTSFKLSTFSNPRFVVVCYLCVFLKKKKKYFILNLKHLL
jgi:hypothetical protein